MTPFFQKIIDTRRELLQEKGKEFDELYEKIGSSKSQKEIKRLEAVNSEIKELKTFPKYLDIGVLGAFIIGFSSYSLGVGMIAGELNGQVPAVIALTSILMLPVLAFFVVGLATLEEVARALRQDWKSLDKEKIKIEEATGEMLAKLQKEVEYLKRQEENKPS